MNNIGPEDQGTLRAQLSEFVTELLSQGISLEQAKGEFERQFIISALRVHGGNFGRAANSLGVHRNTLRNKISSLGISQRDYLPPESRRKLEC